MRKMCGSIVTLALLASAAPAHSTMLVQQNVVDLIGLSESIVAGSVVEVSDGFDASGYPYTEVTLALERAIKGHLRGRYTFRQFGLLAPRQLAGGRTYLAVTPPGWPRYAAGDHVLLFLYRPASITGFQTTVGLVQGKFDFRRGELSNGLDNAGLFRDVSLDAGTARLGLAEQELLQHDSGALDAAAFLSFLEKAVDGRWVETGVISHEN